MVLLTRPAQNTITGAHTVVHNEKRPTHTFMDKNTHILMKRDFHRNKLLKAPATFNRLFDDAYKNHYTNIMQEIERFVTHNIPLEYTQRFTPTAFDSLIMRIKDPITLTTTVDTLNYDDASTQAQSIPSSMRTQLKERKTIKIT
jgi:hypothetical protein